MPLAHTPCCGRTTQPQELPGLGEQMEAKFSLLQIISCTGRALPDRFPTLTPQRLHHSAPNCRGCWLRSR